MPGHRIVIMQDRYSGTYSGGSWLAVARADDALDDGWTHLDFCLSANEGPSGPDLEAASFWADPPSWIAVGDTPDEALSNMRKSLT